MAARTLEGRDGEVSNGACLNAFLGFQVGVAVFRLQEQGMHSVSIGFVGREAVGMPLAIALAKVSCIIVAVANTRQGSATALEARDLGEVIGFAQEEPMHPLMPLYRTILENVARLGIENNLTGPVTRGHIATLEKYLESLRHSMTGRISLYS